MYSSHSSLQENRDANPEFTGNVQSCSALEEFEEGHKGCPFPHRFAHSHPDSPWRREGVWIEREELVGVRRVTTPSEWH